VGGRGEKKKVHILNIMSVGMTEIRIIMQYNCDLPLLFYKFLDMFVN
jgi:hypothetical protein